MNPSNFYQSSSSSTHPSHQISSQFNSKSQPNPTLPSNRSTWSIKPDSNEPLNPFEPLSIKPNQQALFTSYPSRLRLGTTSLVQPIFTNSYIQQRLQRAHSPIDPTHHHHTSISTQPHSTPGSISDLGKRNRRVVNYSEHDSHLPEFELEPITDDSNHKSKSNTPRQKPLSNLNQTQSSIHLKHSQSHSHSTSNLNEADELQRETLNLNKRKYGDGQLYLGLEPPAKLIKIQRRKRKPIGIMNLLSLNETQEIEEEEGGEEEEEEKLIPIRIEFETDEIRVRDVFTWNLKERQISPEAFAIEFCHDIDISPTIYAPKIMEQIQQQLKEYSSLFKIQLLPNPDQLKTLSNEELEGIEPDLRVIINLDVQIQTLHLVDRIEWDLASSLTPELFTKQYISDLNLPTSSLPIISHCLHSELLKHKKECISIGLISDRSDSQRAWSTQPIKFESDPLLRERFGSQKGCKRLEGVWREWNECNLFGPKFENVHGEDLEWIEIEKERLMRRARRETARVGRRR
ncbi:hypothetical protein DFH28DRAFT_927333 [Melampsora americana]|nr:hypothetical protein DFH28DRAFT_927333 [Melampsora americana]